MQLHVRPNKQREFLQSAEALLSKTREMKGCMGCNLYQDLGDEDRFCFLQEWDLRLHVDEYVRSEELAILLGAARVLTEPAEIKIDITRGGMEVVKMVRGK